MKTPASLVCATLSVIAVFASARPLDAVTISGNVPFADLDNGPLDEDATPGVFGFAGDLVIEGILECLDAQPLPGHAGGCQVTLVVGGDLLIEAGGAIVTENRRGAGSGGDVTLAVGGDLVLRASEPGVPGGRISTERTTGGNPGGDRGGNVTAQVTGDVSLEAGSAISAGARGGSGGEIELVAEGRVVLAGLVASGPGSDLTAELLDGRVLVPGAAKQAGGPITVRSTSTSGPGLRVAPTGVVVSQGEDGGAGAVSLEGCGIEVHGLVASLALGEGAASATLRSGEGLLVDGSDLGRSPSDPAFAGRLGAVRAGGTHGGVADQAASLFARGDVVVHGPATGSGGGFAVSAGPGGQPNSEGGRVIALSLEGSLTATGDAFQAGRSRPGNAGGAIDLQASGDVTLDGAAVEAVGDLGNGKKGVGGNVFVQSHQGSVSWTGGVGDVRPVGAAVPPARSGSIAVFYCAAVDLAGSLFPTQSAVVPPFPETFQDCSSPGPELPPGESVPVCNQPPVAQDDDVTTDEDTALAGDVLADNGHGADSDPEGQPLSVTEVNGVAADVGSLVVLPSGALLTLNADGTFTYDPNGQFEELAPGETGTDSFSYTIEDPGGLSDAATVTVTITGVNDAPDAVDDAGTTSEDAVLTVVDPGATASLLANDTDPEDDTLTVTAFQDPSAQGAAVLVNADGTFSYDPTGVSAFQALAVGESLVDTFTYTIDDGAGGTDTGTVTITVTGANDAPDAVDDVGTTSEDAVLTVVEPGATASLLANDSDPDASDTLTVSGFQSPSAHGATVQVNADGTFSYDPTAAPALQALAVGESLVDSFTYSVSDGHGGTDTATVTITVTGANDAPVAVEDTGTTSEDGVLAAVDPGATASLLANDVDPDASDVLAVTAFQNPSAQGAGVSVNADGTFGYDPTGVAAFQALRPGESALDTFTYTVGDGHGGTDTATVTVTVQGANDAPVAVDDLAATVGNTELAAGGAAGTSLAYVAGATNLLANDADPAEGTAITLVAAAGDLSGPPFVGPTALGGEVTVFGDGSFRYVPPAGVKDRTGAAADSFGYTIQDADGGAASGTVAVEIADSLVWYVHNDPSDPANPAGGDGRSTDPFDKLSDGPLDVAPDDAEDASAAGDTVFLFRGDGTSASQDQGIALQAGQSLLGHRAATLARGGLTIETPAPAARPRIANVNPGGDGVSVLADGVNGDRPGIEIRGLEVEGTDDAVEVRAAGAANAELAITDVVLSATAGAALEVDGAATSGTVTVTELAESAVTAAGGGMVFEDVVFDADLGTPGLQPVAAGDVRIGDPASPGDVTGTGLRLNLVRGSLVLGDLDVGNTGGPGVWVRDADGKIGTFALSTTGGTVVTLAGSALDIDPVSLGLVFDSLTSVGSPGNGLNFDTVVGTLISAVTTVEDAGGVGIRVLGSGATLDFGVATVDQTPGGTAVHLMSNTGTTRFGDLAVNTGAGPGVVASNGGTLSVLGSTSTIAATGGAALDLASTSLGGGATFAAVSSSGSPGHGVSLQNVAGAFAATGGAISGAAGPAFRVSGGAAPVTYGGSISNADGLAVEVTGRAGGTVTFSGAVADAGATNAGISLGGNAGAVVFTGATSLTDTAGPALQVTGGTAAVSFAGLTIQQTNGQPGIATSNVAGGSLVLAGGSSVSVSGTGAGVDAVTLDGSGAPFDVTIPAMSLATNAMRHGLVLSDLGAGSDVTIGGGTITAEGAGRRPVHFAGPTAGSFELSNVALAADGSDGIAIGAAESGTYQLGDLDVDAPNGGVGVTVSGSPAAVSFRSVDQAGGTTGISLAGTTGSFAVTGSGAAGSGGTITGTSSHAVSLSNTRDVTLTSMVLQDPAGHGVSGTGVDGFTLAETTVSGAGNAAGENGLAFNTPGATNLTGTVVVSGSTITGMQQHGVHVENAGGVLQMTVSGSVFSGNVLGGDGILFEAGGSADMSLEITGGSQFTDLGGDGLQANLEGLGPGDDPTMSVTVADSSFTNLGGGTGAIAVTGVGGSLNDGSFDIRNNTLTGIQGVGIAVAALDDSELSGSIAGNAVQGTGAEGIFLVADGGANPASSPRVRAVVRDNTVGGQSDVIPLRVRSRDGTGGRVDVQLEGNTIAAPADGGFGGADGMSFRAEDSMVICLDVRDVAPLGTNNASAGTSEPGSGLVGYRLTQAGSSTFQLEGFPGGSVASFFASESNVGSVATSGTIGAGPCDTP